MNQKTLILSLTKINIFYVFMIVFAALFALYFFLAVNTALIVANKNSFDDERDLLYSKLGDLESQYIDITGKINIDLAYKMGFKENLEETIFITRKNNTSAFLSE